MTSLRKRVTRNILRKFNRDNISLVIDLIDACSLKCPSCAVGSIGHNRGSAKMSIELWEKILDKAQSEHPVDHIQMYSFSDCCLHPHLHLFIQDATDRGLPTYISTMLQRTRCDFEKVIEARPHEFRISFPGFKQMHYYQYPGNPEEFKKKFAEVVKLPRHPETTWTMAFHIYNDNHDEIQSAKKMAEDNGIKFVPLPVIFMPVEKVVEKNYTKQDLELISHLMDTPEECISHIKVRNTWCHCWNQINLDAKGDVHLCQLMYEDRFKLGVNFMDMHSNDILKMIRNHSFCGKCMKAGANDYNVLFSDFTKHDDPVGECDRILGRAHRA